MYENTTNSGIPGLADIKPEVTLGIYTPPEDSPALMVITQQALIDSLRNPKKKETEAVPHVETLQSIAGLYRTKRDKDGNVSDIVILYAKFIDLLFSLGFRRFDVENSGYLLVKVENNIVEQVSPVQIQDCFFQLLKQLPQTVDGAVSKDMLIEKFTRGRETFFGRNLSLLRNDRDFEFCTDTKNEVFIYFKNGYVCCTKDGYRLYEYTELKKYIWKNQILPRFFKKLEIPEAELCKSGYFAKFINNICGGDTTRIKAICTIIGYSLHYFFEGKQKAVILTDSAMDDNNGRTGKTLLIKALREVKPTKIINGKDFDPANKFKYQEVELQTQIISINDAKKGINIEDFYNDITEGLTVEKKNQAAFFHLVKLLITTNRTIKIVGASAKDRVIEFEFSNYYREDFSPEDEFGVWFFGKDWTEVDWHQFYNFICCCISEYLRSGIVVPNTINLDRRKLIEQTNEDFVRWMDDQIAMGKITPNQWYGKKDLHEAFKKAYDDYAVKGFLSVMRNFTTCLRTYANLYPHFAPINKATDEKRSNGLDSICFRPATTS